MKLLNWTLKPGRLLLPRSNEGEYVSVIKVTSYKCGEKVAEVYRELQTVIASGCASNEPPLISPIANNSYRDTIKVGDTVRFRITILDSIRADNPNVDSLFIFASGSAVWNKFHKSRCRLLPTSMCNFNFPVTRYRNWAIYNRFLLGNYL